VRRKALAAPADYSHLFIELGCVAVGLAVLARLARRFGLSAISLFLLAGLAFGTGGLLPLNLSKHFIQLGAELGVLLLLFMLGLEYSGENLTTGLRKGASGAAIDLLLNFPPGLIAGVLLGWSPLASVLLGGITLVTSSGIVARVLTELKRMDAPETPTVLSILVLEDLMMAVYLPLVAVLLAGGGPQKIFISVGIACATVLIVLFIATRYGHSFSSFVAHQSDEVVLLSIFGTVLLVAGVAQHLRVSAAIGAFLVGIAVSGPITEQTHRLLTPLRDLFAATFFFFFGLEVDPRTLPPVILSALALAVVTTASKVLTGYWATRTLPTDRRSRFRAGLTLVPRGEFSIVIAGLGAAIEPRIGSLSAAYVLLMAIVGPILARAIR
jgi:monovalent cation:H+ antiporter-2, CPA2 family